MVTVALTGACAVAMRVEGGCWTKAIIGDGAVMLISATAALAGVVAAEEAVMVATPPVGIADGAVYVIDEPLAVCPEVGLKVPQGPALPQVAVQFTPSPFESLATVAVNVADPPSFKVLGGAEVMVTTIGAAVVTVAAAVADFVPSDTDVAVMVTVLPLGAVEGPW